jgi:hypothetical protein
MRVSRFQKPEVLIFSRLLEKTVPTEPTKLVTLSGECFGALFEEARSALPHRDGTLHYFRLNDLIRNRGERLVSLFFFNFDRLSIPQYDLKLPDARLNAIRRAFDSGALSFDSPYDLRIYHELPLTIADFSPRLPASDIEIRQYIIHKAYWLSYKYGSYPTELDGQCDLNYLGIDHQDVKRGIWYLNGEHLVDKVNVGGHARATIKLVKAYESAKSTSLPHEIVFPAGTQFEAFRKITSILQSANTEIFIADNYVNSDVLEMLAAVSSKPSIKLLTFKPSVDFKLALQKFRSQFGLAVEARVHNAEIHDRAIAIDDVQFYALGASIKGAGAKLSLINKLEDVSVIGKLRAELQRIWAAATLIS